MSKLKEGLARLRARAYAIYQFIPDPHLKVTGGYKTIFGQRRFIPLGIQKLHRHCKSCAYYSKLGICQLNGAFIKADTKACRYYTSKNEGKVKVNWE